MFAASKARSRVRPGLRASPLSDFGSELGADLGRREGARPGSWPRASAHIRGTTGTTYSRATSTHGTSPAVCTCKPTTIHIPGPAGVSDFIDTALGSRLLLEPGLGV